mmetsp:Transcript_12898/g.15026  ORF Transcript_12898/g.15026 Transcript_12898/m.15026 type:complete len:121 (-) Transcript_12898:258-620(-)
MCTYLDKGSDVCISFFDSLILDKILILFSLYPPYVNYPFFYPNIKTTVFDPILPMYSRNLNNDKIRSQLQPTLSKMISRDRIRKYWIKSKGIFFNETDDALIDGEGFQSAEKGSNNSRNR